MFHSPAVATKSACNHSTYLMDLLGRLLGAFRREAVIHAEAGVQFLPVVLVEGLVRLVVLEVVRLLDQSQL